MNNYIAVNLQVEGFHNWPDAPVEHSYLRNVHRHIFHIKVIKKVNDLDREIEIINFKRDIEKYITGLWGCPVEFNHFSCEMIALALVKHFDLFSCQVLEDNENGAIVTNG